jgi:hypothetical protein
VRWIHLESGTNTNTGFLGDYRNMMQKGRKKSLKEKEETQEPSKKEGTKTLIFNLNKKRKKGS